VKALKPASSINDIQENVKGTVCLYFGLNIFCCITRRCIFKETITSTFPNLYTKLTLQSVCTTFTTTAERRFPPRCSFPHRNYHCHNQSCHHIISFIWATNYWLSFERHPEFRPDGERRLLVISRQGKARLIT